MNHGSQPSWERIIAWIVVGAISVDVLAAELPRVLPYVVVLAVIFVVVRLVLFYTQKW